MLSGAESSLYGAGGGLVVEAVVTFGRLHAWQQARHVSRVAGDVLPKLGAYIDPPADSLAALFRVVLGCAAGWLLHGELGGMLAAVAVGASAPAVLAQMGSATTVTEALQLGTMPSAAAEGVPGAAPGPAVPGAPNPAVPQSASAVPGAPGASVASAAPASQVSPAPASGEVGP